MDMKKDVGPANGSYTPTDHIDAQEAFPRDVISEQTKQDLSNFSQLHREDYRRFKTEFLAWMLTTGADTYRRNGYAIETTRVTHYKIEKSYRWLWNRDGEYTTTFTPDLATELLNYLMKHTEHPDSVVADFEKALNRLFAYYEDQHDKEIEWEHEIPIEPSRGSEDHFKDRFYPDEMNDLYEAALSEYSVKSYYNKNLTSEERDNIKSVLAQRFGKNKTEIGPDDFSRASSWKIPSIVAATSDLGLRPIEVGRASVNWLALDKAKVMIPKEDATKSSDSWVCELSQTTVNALENWLDERRSYETYSDTEHLWLTEQHNPWSSQSLNYVLDNIIERANLNTRSRNISWYSFRHGVATLWANEEGLSKAKEQLRHKNLKTTQSYVRNSDERSTKNRANSKW